MPTEVRLKAGRPASSVLLIVIPLYLIFPVLARSGPSVTAA
jgi:hypothetical protein